MTKTELVQKIQQKHGVRVSSRLRFSRLKSLLRNISTVKKTELCILTSIRNDMEEHVQENMQSYRTQLSCNGRCTTFGCPNLIVLNCYNGFKDYM